MIFLEQDAGSLPYLSIIFSHLKTVTHHADEKFASKSRNFHKKP
jgi:hypothetical protein